MRPHTELLTRCRWSLWIRHEKPVSRYGRPPGGGRYLDPSAHSIRDVAM